MEDLHVPEGPRLRSYKSIVENDKLELAKSLLAEAGDKIVLGTDVVVTTSWISKARTLGMGTKVVSTKEILSIGKAWTRGPDDHRRFPQDLARRGTTAGLEWPGRRVSIDGSAKAHRGGRGATKRWSRA